MIYDEFSIKILQQLRIGIVVRNQREHAGTVSMNDSIGICRNTTFKDMRKGNYARISHNNTFFGLENDGVTNPKRCPGIVDVLMLHIFDNWIIICRGSNTT